MFTGKVCRLLQITKLTLNNCQREGKVKGLKLPNGYCNALLCHENVF